MTNNCACVSDTEFFIGLLLHYIVYEEVSLRLIEKLGWGCLLSSVFCLLSASS